MGKNVTSQCCGTQRESNYDKGSILNMNGSESNPNSSRGRMKKPKVIRNTIQGPDASLERNRRLDSLGDDTMMTMGLETIGNNN